MFGYVPNMFGCRSATAADNINQPIARPFIELAGHFMGRFIIFTHLVRQAGIGMCRNIAIGDPGDFHDRGP